MFQLRGYRLEYFFLDVQCDGSDLLDMYLNIRIALPGTIDIRQVLGKDMITGSWKGHQDDLNKTLNSTAISLTDALNTLITRARPVILAVKVTKETALGAILMLL